MVIPKKQIPILIILVFVICWVVSIGVVAADSAVVTVGSTAAAANPGDTITVPVTISGNPGVAAYGLTIAYDSNSLTLNSIANAAGLCSGGIFDANTAANGTAYVSWITGGNSDMTDNGDLFYLNFTVNKNASGGNYTVACALTDSAASNFINYAEQDVDVSIVSGTIKVTANGDGGGGAGGGGSSSGGDVTAPPDTPVPIEPTTNNFSDVASTYWAYNDIEYLASLGIINGKSGNQYCPTDNITRAEFVTILARMSGETLPIYDGNFNDVDPGSYYAQAVAWALAANITNGTSASGFSPDSNITRQDMAALIYRYAAYKGYSFDTVNAANSFGDQSDIANYALNAVIAMQRANIISGYSDNSFKPLGNATRAEAAKMLAILNQIINSSI